MNGPAPPPGSRPRALTYLRPGQPSEAGAGRLFCAARGNPEPPALPRVVSADLSPWAGRQSPALRRWPGQMASCRRVSRAPQLRRLWHGPGLVALTRWHAARLAARLFSASFASRSASATSVL